MSTPDNRHTRFEAIRLRLEAFDSGTGWRLASYEFLLFGFKQGWACLFGALLLPLLVGFGLVALFIWFAENIATFANAWNYPGQEQEWQMVSLAKYGSWYLLMLISFVLVALVQPVKAPD